MENPINPYSRGTILRRRYEITIEFFCEGPRSDEFNFQILTGLTWSDLEMLEIEGKTIRREMGIKLLRRISD